MAVAFLIQLLGNRMSKATKDVPSVLAPDTHVGDPEDVLGFWFQTFGEMNQWMEVCALFLKLSLFQINI